MPFDIAVETPALRRAILVEALRNDKNWKWNFNNVGGCGTGCAVGMMKAIWHQDFMNYLTLSSGISKSLAIPTRKVRKIFGFTPTEAFAQYGCNRKDVTPAMVADALEAAVA